MIIQSGIRTVIYFSDKHSDKSSTVASKRMMDMAGVTYRQFVPRMKKIEIDDCPDPALDDHLAHSLQGNSAT
jgi:dCMP deaminase